MRKLGLLKENSGVSVVALTPDNVKQLIHHYQVLVEKGAGDLAGFTNLDYALAGARIVSNREYMLEHAEVIVTHSSTIDFTTNTSKKTVIGSYDVMEEYASVLQFKNTPINFYSLKLHPKATQTESNNSLNQVDRSVSNQLGDSYTEFLHHFRLHEELDQADEILTATMVTKEGKIVHQQLIAEINTY